MMLALVSFSVVAVAGREASKGVTTSELIFLRNLIGAVILSGLLWGKGWRFTDLRTSVFPLHLIRNVIHFGAQYSWLYALTLMPLAELFAIEFTAPLWVAVVAPFVLGERLTAARLLAASLGFIGALVVAQPGILDGSFQMSFSIGAKFALLAALGFAFSMVSTKFLTRTEPVFRILIHHACGADDHWVVLAAAWLSDADTDDHVLGVVGGACRANGTLRIGGRIREGRCPDRCSA